MPFLKRSSTEFLKTASHQITLHSYESTFNFRAVGISDADGTVDFGFPTSTDSVSGSIIASPDSEKIQVRFLSLATIIRDLSLDTIDYMKMDIEGAEYRVIESFSDMAPSFLPKQLAVEFHHFVDGFSREQTINPVNALKDLGYKIAWTSAISYEVLFVLV
tara:strand:- start:8321 stop:8803 length:483 start_codon:yes stop_codon:yes gene_type:complete